MVEIKAGAELDRAVAEAIGWRIDSSRPLDWIGSNGVAVDEFHPSTDLNAAFVAAEKRFDCGFALHTPGKPLGGWEYCRCIVGVGWSGCSSVDQVEFTEDTPALAICAAILALSKVKQS